MEEQGYAFKKTRKEFRYEFVSISEEKSVKKLIVLTETRNYSIFNLALLDIDDNGVASDDTETNNGDMRIVMATVIKVIDSFLSEEPNKLVLFKSEDDRRQRLYRIVISRELELIKTNYNVYGELNGKIELFKTGKKYTSYLIGKK